MSNLQTQPRYYDNELSLFDLIKLFWQHKRLILVVTFCCISVAAFYLQLATPRYEAKISINPPRIDDIARANIGRSYAENASMKAYSIEDIYQIFGDVLMSESLKNTFFKSVYLPSLSEQQKVATPEILFKNFSTNMRIKENSTDELKKYTVIFNAENSIKSKEFVEQYIFLAEKKALSELQESINIQNKIQAESIRQKIDRIRDLAKKDRTDQLAQLKNALVSAKIAGIQNLSFDGLSKTRNDSAMLFMLGTKVLESEIKILLAGEISYSFASKLRKLESELNFYTNLQIPVETVKMFRRDKVVASSIAVFPQKNLILLTGMIGGLMLSFAIVFVINSFPGKNYSRVT